MREYKSQSLEVSASFSQLYLVDLLAIMHYKDFKNSNTDHSLYSLKMIRTLMLNSSFRSIRILLR